MIDWSMGGYGAYVWPCFGLSAVALLALLIHAVLALRAAHAKGDIS